MATAALATLTDVKTYASIVTINTDAVLTQLLASSLPAIEGFCNRKLANAAVIEYRDGNDASRMQVIGYPITSITSIYVNGIPVPASVNGSAGYFYTGRTVVLIGYKFYAGQRNVNLNYAGGYGVTGAAWPDDLKLAYMMYITTRLKERTRLGIGSETLAGQSVTVADGGSGTSSKSQGIPAAARSILQNYMNTLPESGQ